VSAGHPPGYLLATYDACIKALAQCVAVICCCGEEKMVVVFILILLEEEEEAVCMSWCASMKPAWYSALLEALGHSQ
jgi:hypothetical protein